MFGSSLGLARGSAFLRKRFFPDGMSLTVGYANIESPSTIEKVMSETKTQLAYLQSDRPPFFVFSGGPGAGKTSVLTELNAQGYQVVDEAARKILQEQAAIGGDATHDGDRVAYLNLMIERCIQDYKSAVRGNKPVFFDRGLPELISYSGVAGAKIPKALTLALGSCRYAKTVFLFPPWEEIYCTDTERTHDFAHAKAVYDHVVHDYKLCGYRLVEVPFGTVRERADFVLSRLAE